MIENKNFKRLVTFAIAATMCLTVLPLVNADCPPEMVAYWKLDEGIGSTAFDETTNANDGTLSGGKFGNALEFDGVDDYVNFGNDPSLDISISWTISMWVKWQSSSQTYQTLFNKENPPTSGWDIAYSAWIYSNGLYFGMSDADKVWHQDAHMGTIPENIWTHVAITFDGTDARSYINGAHTDTLTIGKIGWTNNANLLIGKRHNSVEIFKGRIDEFAIYNRDLSSQEISDYFNSDAEHILHIDLISLWHFDESVGTDVYDETTNDNDGTIFGATWAGPTWTTGKVGNALSFDGVDDFVSVPANGLSSNPMTITWWMNTNDMSGVLFMDKNNWFDTEGIEIWLYSNTGGYGYLNVRGSSGTNVPSSSDYHGEWVHVAVVFDDTTVMIYRNGAYDTSGTIDSVVTSTQDFLIGIYPGLSGWYYNGIIDEVAIFNTALSSDDIAKLYCTSNNFGFGYCDPPSLTYTGTLLFSDTDDFVLEATLKDSDGNGMSGYNIEFFVNGGTVGNASTNGSGVVSKNLGPNDVEVYEVYAKVHCLESDIVFIAVYDPTEGFVTGGGWIMSPAGAYKPNPTLIGKANFGFVSKYKKGQSTPTGNTEFKFEMADLDFHSDNYEWLVITGGNKAMYKGTGTINDAGSYKFMLTAYDDNPDTFRIRIWEEDEFGVETTIYDNDTDTQLGGGQIKIHQN